MTEQCNRCRFWLEKMKHRDPNDENWGFGYCRLKPPVISETYVEALMPKLAYGQQEAPEINTVSLTTCTLYPATTSTDWCGAFVARPADKTAIRAAFAEMTAAYRELHGLQSDAEADHNPLLERIDAAQEVIRRTPSSDPVDIACKVRMALAGINQGGQDTLLLYRLATGDFEGSSFFEEALFDLITDLEAGR